MVIVIVREYIIKGEDSWILDTKLVNFIGALLEHRSLNPDIRAKLVRLLAAGALRDDFWSFLQMDRKDRHLMKYPHDFENLTVEEQKAVTLFLCNNFSSPKVQKGQIVNLEHLEYIIISRALIGYSILQLGG